MRGSAALSKKVGDIITIKTRRARNFMGIFRLKEFAGRAN
jgi:hypothetical protein